MTKNIDNEESNSEDNNPDKTFWGKHGPNIILAALVLYVILLAIGTAAEIFEIGAILDLMIYTPQASE